MGVRGPCGRQPPVCRQRQYRCCGVVLGQRRWEDASSWWQACKRMGALGHERKCQGMVLGLVRLGLVPNWFVERSHRAIKGLQPGYSGRQLDQLREELPLGESLQGISWQSRPEPGLPPREDGPLTFCTLVLLHSAGGRARPALGRTTVLPRLGPAGEPQRAPWKGCGL